MAKLYFSTQDLLGLNPAVSAFKVFDPAKHTCKTVDPKNPNRAVRCSVADKVNDYQEHDLIFEITDSGKVGDDVGAADQESVAGKLADMLASREQ